MATNGPRPALPADLRATCLDFGLEQTEETLFLRGAYRLPGGFQPRFSRLRRAFAFLAVGPLVGVDAMWRLRVHPDAVKLANGNR